MIYYPICRKCQHCKWKSGKVDKKTGGYEMMPSVFCKLAVRDLLMSDSTPDGCLFAIEHVLIEQDVPEDFVAHMSGERDEDET